MTMFADIKAYEARYGAVVDSDRTAALLADAENMVLAAYEKFYGEDYMQGAHPAFDRGAAQVICKLVHNASAAPSMFDGATSISQGAGGYTASVTYGGAVGSMWLGKTDYATLGLTGQHRGVVTPYGLGETC